MEIGKEYILFLRKSTFHDCFLTRGIRFYFAVACQIKNVIIDEKGINGSIKLQNTVRGVEV